jgi:hypothetical protein
MKKATHQGILKIGEREMPCAVLDDGTRIISRNAIFRAFGRTKRGRKKDEIRVLNMPAFIDAKNLQSFINEDLGSVLNSIEYQTIRGHIVTGYDAKILPLLCDLYLAARSENKLTASQMPLAAVSEMLIRSFAKVGIIALIDEATGYQEIRDRLALQEILDKYLRQEWAKWAKRFPDEFYMEMFRLKGWQWRGMSINRPILVGKYTDDIVYQRLAPGVRNELRKLNPKDETGRRKQKHHQWLTEDIGVPALSHHLTGVMALMRAASNYEVFKRMLARAFPKPGEQLELDIYKNS